MKKFLFPTAILALSGLLLVSMGWDPGNEQLESVSVKTFNYPLLVGREHNPAVRIMIENTGEAGSVSAINLTLDKAGADNLQSISAFYSGEDSTFQSEDLFDKIEAPSKTVTLEGTRELEPGVNYFWISLELKEDRDLTSEVGIQTDRLSIGGSSVEVNESEGPEKLRLGVSVRDHMDDDVHTYRIPGLSTSKQGTLLSVYDVRRDSRRDLQGDMDIGLSRSTDGGEHWEPMQIVLDKGEWGDLPEKFNGVSDANILVDENSGTIFVSGLWMYGVIDENGVWQEGLTEESDVWNHQWRTKGSQPGFGVKETSQFLITSSTDDGKTWSEPINITRMCKDPNWWLFAPAPGHGITLKDGTLVIPTQGRDENGLPFSNITYSKDGGKTWVTSNPATHNTTECMAVELSDGSIMLNIRDNRNREDKSETNGRAVAVTKDLGQTWTDHPTSHGALIEPTCMASIHRHDYVEDNGDAASVLLFSNPNSKFTRHKQTLKVSFDNGNTWPENYWIELDEGRGSGYSCITSIDKDHIGILYEGSQAHMTFQQLSLQDILHGQE